MVSVAMRNSGIGLLVAGLVFGGVGAMPALAAPPPAPATEFEADPCPGETYNTPDLLVTGENLDNYNAGGVVGLYDHEGSSPWEYSFPPLCGVRYLSEEEGGPVGGGPVSAWMFCSDAFLDVCHDERPLSEVGPNTKLTPFQQRIFAHMVQNGVEIEMIWYEEVVEGVPYAGYFPINDVNLQFAAQDLDSNARAALQYALWCVTDYPIYERYNEFCEVNGLDTDSLPVTFDFLVDDPGPVLTVTSTGTEGATATFAVSTRVAEPINITTSGNSVTLCGGEGTFEEGILTLPADAEALLCVTGTGGGTVTLSATVRTEVDTALQWFNNTDPDCQVFALFPSAHDVVASAESSTLSTPEGPVTPGTPGTTPNELAKTGVDQAFASWMLATGALATVLLGVALVAMLRLRRV